jgi:hypothetical protein
MAGAPRVSLALSAVGAVLALLDPGEPVGGLVGLGLMLVGAVALAPRRRAGAVGGDANWPRLLLAGTALAAVGIPLALVVETLGGLLAAVGAAAVIAAVALGFPERGAA